MENISFYFSFERSEYLGSRLTSVKMLLEYSRNSGFSAALNRNNDYTARLINPETLSVLVILNE